MSDNVGDQVTYTVQVKHVLTPSSLLEYWNSSTVRTRVKTGACRVLYSGLCPTLKSLHHKRNCLAVSPSFHLLFALRARFSLFVQNVEKKGAQKRVYFLVGSSIGAVMGVIPTWWYQPGHTNLVIPTCWNSQRSLSRIIWPGFYLDDISNRRSCRWDIILIWNYLQYFNISSHVIYQFYRRKGETKKHCTWYCKLLVIEQQWAEVVCN